VCGLPGAEVQGRPQVVPLGVQPPEQFGLVLVECGHGSGQGADPLQVPLPRAGLFAHLAQSLPAELAKGVQQPVPGRVPARQVSFDDRRFDQRPKEFHYLGGWHLRVGADVGGGVGVEAPGEDRQPGPQHPFGFVEQPVAPADGRLQCLLPGLGGPVSAAQGRQLARQASVELVQAQRAQPYRG
jgi:hypothetical protein